jgi:transcriptional regulator with XRE-family HTH domain
MIQLTTTKISARLKTFRKKLVLNQTDVAVLLSLNKQMVCYWERGSHTPMLAHLIKLSEKYRIPFDYWIIEDDEKALTLLNGNSKNPFNEEELHGNEFTILDQKQISIPYMETAVIKHTASALAACKQEALVYFVTGNAGIGKSVALERYAVENPVTVLISIPYAGADIAKIQELLFRQLQNNTLTPESVLTGLAEQKRLLIIDNAHWIREDAFSIIIDKLYRQMGLAFCGENSIVKKFTVEKIPIPFTFEVERLFLADDDIRKISSYIFREISDDVYAAVRMRGYDSYFKLAQLKNTCDYIMEEKETTELTINIFYLADFYLMRRLRL